MRLPIFLTPFLCANAITAFSLFNPVGKAVSRDQEPLKNEAAEGGHSMTSIEFFRTYQHKVSRPFSANGTEASWADTVTNPGGGPLKPGQEIGSILIPPHPNAKHIVLNPQASLLAISTGSEVRLYKYPCLTFVKSLDNQVGVVDKLAFSPDGRTLVIAESTLGQRDAVISFYDLNHPPSHTPADKRLEVINEVWRATVLALEQHADWNAGDFASSDLSGSLQTVLRDAMVRRDQRYNTVLSGSLSSFESPVFSPDGSILLYQPTRTTLAAWDIKERKEIWSYSHSDAIMASEVSPDGRLVASSAWDQTVQIRNIITGELIHTLVGAHGQNWAVKFSPDSSLVAGGSGDQTLRIWDVNSGKLIHAFDGFRGWIRSISFSDNLRYVSAGASGGHLRIFDIKEGKEVQRWEVDISGRWTRGFIETRGVRYLDADTVAFSTSDGTITVYDAKENVKWEIARRWDGASFPGGFVQTPDGKQIITLDADATVRVWELKRAA